MNEGQGGGEGNASARARESENPPEVPTAVDVDDVADLLHHLQIVPPPIPATTAPASADPRILTFVVKEPWYSLMESGEKRVEYRKVCLHWKKRLLTPDDSVRAYDIVRFTNGYSTRTRTAPEFSAFWKGMEIRRDIDETFSDGSRIQMEEAFCTSFDIID